MSKIMLRSLGRLYNLSGACRIMNYTSGELGSKSGRVGDTSSTISGASGSFGKTEATHDEEYYRRLQQDVLSKIKREHQEQCLYHDDEIKFHEEALSRHAESIERHRVLRSQHEATLRQHDGEEKQQLHNQRNVDREQHYA